MRDGQRPLTWLTLHHPGRGAAQECISDMCNEAHKVVMCVGHNKVGGPPVLLRYEYPCLSGGGRSPGSAAWAPCTRLVHVICRAGELGELWLRVKPGGACEVHRERAAVRASQGWEEAASQLSGTAVKLRTASAALFQCTAGSWRDVMYGSVQWQLVEILTPAVA
jgi:hypothetical protein